MRRSLYRPLAACLGSLLFIASALYAEDLPATISDEAYWKIITELSEPDGNFPSENFISNERAYQQVVPDLTRRVVPGGVYLGVGPEQNFTYIAAVQPKIAFIVDIRRQNMIAHLMYKALFELSANRIQFLSLLFSRPLPATPLDGSKFENVLAALNNMPSDPAMYDSTLSAIETNLQRTHGFNLTDSDVQSLEHVFFAFYVNGPTINYSGKPPNTPESRFYPSYLDLLLETGPGAQSEHYLSTEDTFRTVKNMQKDNRIIPLVGDFAGSLALRGLGDYLREHDAAVSTFYTSNVEHYLFLDPVNWKNFYRNVASFPLDPKGVVIRALIQKDNGAFSNLPTVRTGYLIKTMLFSLPDLASAFDEGRIHDYGDVLRTANLTVPDVSAMKIEITDPNPNAGIFLWPNLEPPANLTATAISAMEITLKWPRKEQGDITGFQISKQTAGSWGKPIHASYSSVCGSDPCSYRDTSVNAATRYCYFVQAADDYSNLNSKLPLNEDFGDASITVCATPSTAERK